MHCYRIVALLNRGSGQNLVSFMSNEVCATLGGTKPVVTNAQNELLKPTIYPNPVKDFLTIPVTGTTQIKIYNQKGQKLGEETLDQANTSLDFRNYQNGMYWLKIQSQNSTSFTRIIKN